MVEFSLFALDFIAFLGRAGVKLIDGGNCFIIDTELKSDLESAVTCTLGTEELLLLIVSLSSELLKCCFTTGLPWFSLFDWDGVSCLNESAGFSPDGEDPFIKVFFNKLIEVGLISS